ncbi:hypothetical protein B0H66DRAFT_607127 [Apodospora peruviana]|uniref:Zn(2)-C6 fungal-type domain-containing protein n=1 Tax=Apodospora peruviana TaxID=516989 RepID=A0AAE0HW70_9PEZI|nr:hypothetical protein B0H66DRAFT_607127 [Apodospora peruviana]
MQFTGFANTFLVVPNGRDQPTLRVVGPEDDVSRRKRPHRKSRLGCVRCKKRKVKCDEAYPCGNCVKRNETCVRHRPAGPRDGDDYMMEGTSAPHEIASTGPSRGPGSEPINLVHMELLHHFERFTIPTLCFQEIWPTMLQLAFHSQQHTYLVNAVLSLAAAHLAYLVPGEPRYHQANYGLLDKALRDYRKALSSPITASNCDALLGTAILVHHLMWCDLSFMEVRTGADQPLDLSADRLYWLSTGVRQIFFMAWPLFQTAHSVFMRVPVLQPCMALEDVVDARGLNWQRTAQGFMDLYDNPRYHGGRDAFPLAYSPSYLPASQSPVSYSSPTFSSPTFSSPTFSSTSSDTIFDNGTAWPNDVPFNMQSLNGHVFKVATLWQSYKMGEIFVESAGQHNKTLERDAYERLAVRLAVAIAFIEDRDASGGCPASSIFATGPTPPDCARSVLTQADIVRYVLTFPMLCFGPFLPLISGGDSRALVLLFHIYRVVGILLPTDEHWWCRRRAKVMESMIRSEIRSRGLEFCLRRQNEVA